MLKCTILHRFYKTYVLSAMSRTTANISADQLFLKELMSLGILIYGNVIVSAIMYAISDIFLSNLHKGFLKAMSLSN